MPSWRSASTKMLVTASFWPCCSRMVKRNGSPAAFRSVPPSAFHPASSSRRAAARMFGAVARRAVRGRQRVGVERPRRQLGLERRQQRAHPPLGRPLPHAELRVGEVARPPRQRPGVQRPVDELVVEGVQQRVAHPPVGEDRPPGVEDESLHPRRPPVRHLLERHRARPHRREAVVARPPRRAGLAVDREVAGGEGLEQHARVDEVLVADRVEVVHAPVDRQVPPPVVGVALEGRRTAPARRRRSRKAPSRPAPAGCSPRNRPPPSRPSSGSAGAR